MTEKQPPDDPLEIFARSLLSLYNGPLVTIQIGNGREYRISRPLICGASYYFQGMLFEGAFQEAKEQSAVLEPIERVLSEQNFELLIKYLYLGQVKLPKTGSPTTDISTAIQFARLADMYQVDGLQEFVAKKIRKIIMTNPGPTTSSTYSNTYWITYQHIASAANLPRNHSVRSVLANALVEGYLTLKEFKFYNEIRNIPSFSTDILEAVTKVIKKTSSDKIERFKLGDPITKRELYLGRTQVQKALVAGRQEKFNIQTTVSSFESL
ncbi:hypothetical protein BO71DRAFT_433400 [Aspergillus ellipticus CBS 707.79]|uniref:BTB domain-containing protein n=1 Tax=Aspergillus ellipticus CBS 707.79 TaxID=1448320 RepID=A0A319D1L6_9EURO|nr:hypothetical protein BO71DRAFT_433400 [Aspergillus ellipticus CBS 707.79]